MPKIKLPTLNGLAGSYVLDPNIRKSLHIPPNILRSEASSWKSVKSVVDDYFQSTNRPRNSASRAHEEIINALKAIKDMDSVKKFHLPLKQYASKICTFLKTRTIRRSLKKYIKESICYDKRKSLERMQYNKAS